MTPAELLTKSITELARKDLKRVRNEKSMAARVGLIIQALRNAIKESNVYMWCGIPYIFDGKIYVPVQTSEFKNCIFDILAEAKMEPGDFVQIEKLQRMALQAVMGKPLSIRKDIVVFENCVLMLGEMGTYDDDEIEESSSAKRRKKQPIIRPHSPELAQITMCHFEFDPLADCPKWKTFLEFVLDNAQARMVLQEFLGCIYIDRKQCRLESMLILVGNGSNGKSVVSETVRGIVGTDSMTAYGLDSILVGQESLHNIAKMNGMRANWCTEIQAIQAGRFSDKLKSLISGDPIECRQLYGLPFTANEIPLMMANCNSLPTMQDKSYGMQRRFVIIRFEHTIPVGQQDKHLVDKLKDEWPGIFNWILDGRQRFIEQKLEFTDCKAIEKAVQNFEEDANNVEEFMHVRTYEPAPSCALDQEPWCVSSKSLYNEYTRWCTAEHVVPFGELRFAKCLTNAGYTRTRSAKGSSYRLFGERAFANLARDRKKELTKTLVENGGILDGQELHNGIIWDVGDYSASDHWHVSRPYLANLRAAGYLDGVWKRDWRMIDNPATGRKAKKLCFIYNHNRLGRRLEECGVYDSASGKELTERREKQIKRALEFNELMRSEGKPFRKLVGKGRNVYPKNSVFVDGDWEYTADNAEALLAEIDIQKEILAKEREVKVSKKGKMMTKSNKQKLADVIAATNEENRKNADRPSEIDLDDQDYKIE